MKKQSFITILLTVLMDMTGAKTFAHDIVVANADGSTIYYVWINNNTELAVSYQGSYVRYYSNEYSGNVVIPKSVEFNGKTYPVTSIGDYTFYGCSGLTSVTIPNSVTSIGDDAFSGCSGLTSVTIPNSVTSIGNSAFFGCSGLTSVTIPNSVTSIGNYAFSGCSGLTFITVESGNPKYDSRDNCDGIIETESNTLVLGCKNTIIPNSVTRIGNGAFYGCSGLTSITIPNSVTSIGSSAFNGCSGLTSVTIPNSVTSIGSSAFSSCSGLTFITVESGNPKYDSRDNCDGIIETESNTLVLGYKNTTIPNSVTSIGECAFMNCSDLTSITIPNSVTNIGNNAFEGCSGLTSITIGNSVTSIGDYAFRGCSGLTSITIPNSVTSIGDYAFNGCTALTSITIPNSVTSMGYYAFNGTAWYYNQPDGILYLDNCLLGYKGTKPSGDYQIIEGTRVLANSAFSGCSDLTSITIPNSVTNIGSFAFMDCSNLASVIINCSPDYPPNYDKGIFQGCTALKSATFDCEIVKHLLKGCKSLESVVMTEKVIAIGENAFEGCSGLTSVTIPNSVTSIERYAFYNCSNLKSLVLPSSITTIGNQAFYRCEGLASLVVKCCPTSIGWLLFSNCTSLKEVSFDCDKITRIISSCSFVEKVTISEKVKAIENDAFSGCSGLISISVESGNTKYDSRDNCNAIIETESNTLVLGYKNTTIPNSVTSIGGYAFLLCSGLTSITIPNSVTNIGFAAFNGCSGLTSVTIPNSVTSIGRYAFDGCSSLTSITIPNSVKSIEYEVFRGCSHLTSITIGNGVTSIAEGAFNSTAWYNNQPDGVLYLDNCLLGYKGTKPSGDYQIIEGTRVLANSAFSGCSDLTSITIPNSVTNIGNQAFSECSSLTFVHISDLESWCNIAFEDNPLNYSHRLFLNGVEIKDLVIPNSVTSIGDGAFSCCSSLTSITIPNSVTSIGDGAFYYCSGLTSIISLNNTPPTCEQYLFGDYNQFNNVDKANCVLWVPKGSVNAYKEANGWKDFQNLKELTFGDVNLDGEVNQNDLDALVGFIMGENPEGFYEGLADLNGDNEVNAADVVKLVDILNVQDGLSTDWQPKFDSYQVITSLACTLNNNEDKPIQVTKCELYHDQSLVSYATSNVTLESGESKKCSFDDLASLSDNKGFYVVWHYTYNGESYTCRFNLPE